MRRSLLTLSLLLSAFLAGHAQTQEELKRRAMNTLCPAFTRDNVDQAINDANTAVELQPDQAAAYFRLGQLYESKKDLQAAELNYRKTLETTLIARGRMKASQEKFDEAIKDYSAALAMTPENLTPKNNFRMDLAYLALYYRGLAYAELKNDDRAFDDWNASIQWNPGFAETYYNMGLIRHLRGDTKGAIEAAEKALDLRKGNYRDASLSLGFFYQKQGQWSTAAETYRKALEYSKDDLDLLRLRGMALLEDRQQEALGLLKQVAEAKPEDATSLSDYAAALIQAGRFPEAQQQLEQALGKEPENPAVHERLGDLYVKTNRAGQARESYQKAVGYTDPNDADTMDTRLKKLHALTDGGNRRQETHNNR